jgi:hypothetical protein
LLAGLSIVPALVFIPALAAAVTTLTVRSGNAPPGSPDPLISRFVVASGCATGYPTPFTAAEFSAASTGPLASVITTPTAAWASHLACDPDAQWIGIDAFATPLSALYAINVDIPAPCCFSKATLDFCWLVDDQLGDAVNPAGLYVNGTPIPSVALGDFTTEKSVTGIDVTSLVHCGRNTLYVYDRDMACVVAGVMFSATLRLEDCIVPTLRSTWGTIKVRYR